MNMGGKQPLFFTLYLGTRSTLLLELLVWKSPSEVCGSDTASRGLTCHCDCDTGGGPAGQKVVTGKQKERMGKGCAWGTDPGICNKAKIF